MKDFNVINNKVVFIYGIYMITTIRIYIQ